MTEIPAQREYILNVNVKQENLSKKHSKPKKVLMTIKNTETAWPTIFTNRSSHLEVYKKVSSKIWPNSKENSCFNCPFFITL